MLTDSNPSALASLRANQAEILDVHRDSDEQECAFFDAELERIAAEIANLETAAAALDAIANAPANGPAPVITIKVRRDVREFGAKRTRFVGGWERGHSETYRHEQTRFDFAPTFVDETVEVAVIDESHGQFRLEFASEQHLWTSHKDWRFDPTPTVVADSDEDSQLSGRGVYSVRGVVA